MNAPIVEITSGKIQGTQEEGLQVFRGIPFAQPPLGALRFRPPKPVEPWSGIYQATAFRPSPWHPLPPGLPPVPGGMSEDCLSVNVWTPATGNARRPVLVWIYGGGFTSGSSAQYDPIKLVQHGDMVIVTFNYRLGALGFLYLGDLLAEDYARSGNTGLQDMLLVLRWVQANIAAFGGDPAQVTIMGQSAGAASVGTLLTMPTAQGLFHRAILESEPAAARDRTTATIVAKRLLAALGLAPQEARKLLELPAEQILAAQSRATADLHSYGPVIDGLVLSQLPLEAIRQGVGASLPLLIGSNREEARLDTTLDSQLAHPNRARLTAYFGDNSEVVWAAYQRALEGQPSDEAWVSTLTDYLIGLATTYHADMQADHGTPVWRYRFDYQGPLGASHVAEIPFVWQTTLLGAEKLFPVPTSANMPLSTLMQTAWLHFIRTGNPNGEGVLSWPHYTTRSRQTMLFNIPSRVEALPSASIEPGFSIQQVYVLKEA